MEMKMSDVFGLPLNREESKYFNHLLRSSKSDIPEASFNSSDCAKYAAHAINNHDRLVEENNRLREALKATIKSSWGVINSDDEDFLEKVDLHKNLEGELSRAEELLSEIGGDL
ncbi:TPA: hypothetical protein PMD70_001256 [Vibrio cholerae]|nr:hypothetical protein [Vibrio cholerae]